MPIDVYDKPKFIETCEITQLWIVDPWRRSFSLSLFLSPAFQFSIHSRFDCFTMKFYSLFRFSHYVRRRYCKYEEVLFFWYACRFGGNNNYIIIYRYSSNVWFQRIGIFIRSFSMENENCLFHSFPLLLHFYRNCISILLHAIALALSLDYSWTRLDCTENSNKMELEEFRMKSSFDKLSSCVYCEIRTFFFLFFFFFSLNADNVQRWLLLYTEFVHYIKSVIVELLVFTCICIYSAGVSG